MVLALARAASCQTFYVARIDKAFPHFVHELRDATSKDPSVVSTPTTSEAIVFYRATYRLPDPPPGLSTDYLQATTSALVVRPDLQDRLAREKRLSLLRSLITLQTQKAGCEQEQAAQPSNTDLSSIHADLVSRISSTRSQLQSMSTTSSAPATTTTTGGK